MLEINSEPELEVDVNKNSFKCSYLKEEIEW